MFQVAEPTVKAPEEDRNAECHCSRDGHTNDRDEGAEVHGRMSCCDGLVDGPFTRPTECQPATGWPSSAPLVSCSSNTPMRRKRS